MIRPLLLCSTARRFSLAASLGWLVACSPFPSAEQTPVYELTPPHATDKAAEPRNQTLRLDTPSANRTLHSARILIKPDAQRINAFPGGRWSDSAPVLVREYLIQALRRSGTFDAVINEHSSARSDLTLTSDLRAFHAEQDDGATQVRITVEAQLIHNQTQQVLASERFELHQPSDSSDLPAVVAAFDRASEALSQQLIHWAASLPERRTEAPRSDPE